MGVLAPLVLLMLLAGCGADTDDPGRATEQPSGPSVPITVDGQMQVGCGGGPAWSLDLMDGGNPDLADHDEVVDALRQLVEDAPMDAPGVLRDADGIQDEDWILLARQEVRGEDVLSVGAGTWTEVGPGEDAMSIRLERTVDGWKAGGWGDCRLEPLLKPGSTWLVLSRPDGGFRPTGNSLTMGVNELDCTSGRDPSDFLHEPYVVEDSTSVTVYWTSTSPEGAQNCIGNQPIEASLDLEAPLGDRELLDGSTYPAAPVG